MQENYADFEVFFSNFGFSKWKFLFYAIHYSWLHKVVIEVRLTDSRLKKLAPTLGAGSYPWS